MLFRHLENKLTVVTVLFTLKNMNSALYIALLSRKKVIFKRALQAGGMCLRHRYPTRNCLSNRSVVMSSHDQQLLHKSIF
jgi:hypothetical protein